MEEQIEKIRQYFDNSQKNDLGILKNQILEKIKSFEESVPSFNLNHDTRDKCVSIFLVMDNF